MLKGIVVVASGNQYYGRMAYNLALSVRAAQEPCPVALLHNGSAAAGLTQEYREVFYECVKMPAALSPIQCKLSAYFYSPFDETIYIDADNLWLPSRSPLDLFKQFNAGVMFSGITEGKYNPRNPKDNESNYLFWANPAEICAKWDITNVLYQWRSEVLYFKKSVTASSLFEAALEAYEEPRVDYNDFANTVPDELCINIAAGKLGIAPHLYKWSPTFWPTWVGRLTDMKKIMRDSWIISTGGNTVQEHVKELYENILSYSANKLRRKYYSLRPKTAFMNERFKY